MPILQESDEHEFLDLQFGFIRNRGTSMAPTLTHDVLDYCKSNGSPVFLCALDAEAAFDGIPHSVMFMKAINIIPMHLWRILVHWYRRLEVIVKWGEQSSTPISVSVGTRQGGLSSPYLFNIFYQELINILSVKPCGINIDGTTYNACCYADDLLLCSLSITGLQSLIHASNDYITEHGLRFNPSKTKCMTFGSCNLKEKQWFLNGQALVQENQITHLGVVLANDNHSHTNSRLQAMRKAFYALQGSGLCLNGSNPGTIAHIIKAAIQPVLSFGMECVFQSKSVITKAQSTLAKLLKTALGLKGYSRSTPLLKALDIKLLQQSVYVEELVLFKSLLLSTSRSCKFYSFLLSKVISGNAPSTKSIAYRVYQTCHRYNINFSDYICDTRYFNSCKSDIGGYSHDGLSDTVSFLLHANCDASKNILQILLSPF